MRHAGRKMQFRCIKLVDGPKHSLAETDEVAIRNSYIKQNHYVYRCLNKARNSLP